MESILNFFRDAAIGAGASMIIGSITALILSYVKDGKIEGAGVTVGKWISKIGRSKLGGKNWEKIEDILLVTILSFAKGIKVGSDLDDTLPTDQILAGIDGKTPVKIRPIITEAEEGK